MGSYSAQQSRENLQHNQGSRPRPQGVDRDDHLAINFSIQTNALLATPKRISTLNLGGALLQPRLTLQAQICFNTGPGPCVCTPMHCISTSLQGMRRAPAGLHAKAPSQMRALALPTMMLQSAVAVSVIMRLCTSLANPFPCAVCCHMHCGRICT